MPQHRLVTASGGCTQEYHHGCILIQKLPLALSPRNYLTPALTATFQDNYFQPELSHQTYLRPRGTITHHAFRSRATPRLQAQQWYWWWMSKEHHSYECIVIYLSHFALLCTRWLPFHLHGTAKNTSKDRTVEKNYTLNK